MKFLGHQMYTIYKNWLFDLTTFTGYKLTFENNKIISYEKAFSLQDIDNNGKFEVTKFIDNIPVGIIRKSQVIVGIYYKRTFVGDFDVVYS